VNLPQVKRPRGRPPKHAALPKPQPGPVTLPTMCYSTAFEAKLPVPEPAKKSRQALKRGGLLSAEDFPWNNLKPEDSIALAVSNPPAGLNTRGFTARPFTKWVGGKYKLVTRLLEFVPADFEKYFEPFVGGGSMYYALSPRAKCSYISDLNSELMNTYVQLMVNLEEVKKRLRTYVYDKDFYLQVRQRDRDPAFYESDPVERAVRLLYLLRVGYNGLYRVNSKNHFNVPFGRYTNPEICRDEVLNAASAHLNHYPTKVFVGQYYALLPFMDEKSFVYFDPPYMPVSETAFFTDYQVEGFSYQDQVTLAQFCRELDRRKIRFMLSNSCCDEVRRLYQGFNIHVLDNVMRGINSTVSLRSGHKELVITNY
ncbi:MAG: Dam family site-specific DNA-(adenine-N6)-methyltransferase, partial [Proteobacteria bacterium]|nr:Dam family site-specific DNA-(adenine-N6)-methyltransferase [Candidatus Avisuccinivibrio stercorigallinarum]